MKSSEHMSVFGNKTANLIELKNLFDSIKLEQMTIVIPEFLPLADDTIKKHLDQHAKKWRKLWEQFADLQRTSKTLQQESLFILRELKKIILDCFHENTLPENLFDSFPKDNLLMVRSSGNEDTCEISNPGGNQSIANVKNNEKTISAAIGAVVASYVSQKSLAQRLLSGDNITEIPLMPVLLQTMIHEKNPADIIISGVMYADIDSVMLQAAYGHCEYIVNGKGLFDTYQLSKNDLIHAQIYQKENRIVFDNEGHFALIKNPEALKKAPTLSAKIARNLGNIGKIIAKHYGHSMDIEFIYRKKENILYLVQARPLPLKKLSQASAIDPVELQKIENDKINVTVITSQLNTAVIIRDTNELLHTTHIDMALKKYLREEKIQGKIKAVFIEHLAPSTSHEVAQFNALGIPVLQYIDKTLQNWLKIIDKPLIIDPQHQCIVRWIRDDAPEKIIVQGLFASTQSLKKTLLPIDMIPAHLQMHIKKYLTKNNLKITYRDLLKSIDNIMVDPLVSLQMIANYFLKLSHHPQTQKLFLHAMLSIAEIDKIFASKSDEQKKLLFDAINHLKALIINPGEKNLFSDSILQFAHRQKNVGREFYHEFAKWAEYALHDETRKKWLDFIEKICQNKYQTQMCAQIFLFYAQYHLEFEFINQEFLESDGDIAILYQNMDMARLDCAKYSFADNHRIIQSFAARIPEWRQLQKFPKLMEDFEKNFAPLLEKVDLEIPLSVHSRKIQLRQILDMTDVMDRSIKSLKGSHEYKEQSALHVKRFIQILEPFHAFMMQLMMEIPEKQFEDWAKEIDDYKFYNERDNIIEDIATAFEERVAKTGEEELHPSGFLSVESARFDSCASFYRQFSSVMSKMTLEDLFSLFHQNILAALSYFNKAMIRELTLPEQLQNLDCELTKNNKTQRLGISYTHPSLMLEYNIPLKNHSAKLQFSYHLKNKSLILHGCVFGGNWRNRMEALIEMIKTEIYFLQGKLPREPEYIEDQYTLHFYWEFNKTNIHALTKNISKIIESYLKINYTSFLNYSIRGLREILLRYKDNIPDVIQTMPKDLIHNLYQRTAVDFEYLSHHYPQMTKAVRKILDSNDNKTQKMLQKF